jgi:hypothetical protein
LQWQVRQFFYNWRIPPFGWNTLKMLLLNANEMFYLGCLYPAKNVICLIQGDVRALKKLHIAGADLRKIARLQERSSARRVERENLDREDRGIERDRSLNDRGLPRFRVHADGQALPC